MEKKRVRVPIRSAREMAVAVAADVESRKTMQRCRATLTRSVERYYTALLQDVTTHVDGQLFRVDNVHAYTECQCYNEPVPEDDLLVVQLRLYCAEQWRSYFVDCKMPACWIARRGLPTDIRLDDITWVWSEYPDNSRCPVMDYDSVEDAFVPSVRRHHTYSEWIKSQQRTK